MSYATRRSQHPARFDAPSGWYRRVLIAGTAVVLLSVAMLFAVAAERADAAEPAPSATAHEAR